MTLRRAVLYIAGASLLAAWFSSAASLSLHRNRRVANADHSAIPADRLPINMQAQAKRLKARLAAAPLPQQPVRNPFAFASASPEPRAGAVRRAEPPALAPVPIAPPEPSLSLIGVAEQKKGHGLVRTAMIATEADELIMAAVGDTLMQRYKVTAIGPDAVELTDLATGHIRRLALQFQLELHQTG